MKENILNSNNVIAFDPIKIQTCLAPHSDRQHLISVKDTYVDAKKITTKGHKWPFLKLKFSDFFSSKIEKHNFQNKLWFML